MDFGASPAWCVYCFRFGAYLSWFVKLVFGVALVVLRCLRTLWSVIGLAEVMRIGASPCGFAGLSGLTPGLGLCVWFLVRSVSGGFLSGSFYNFVVPSGLCLGSAMDF